MNLTLSDEERRFEAEVRAFLAERLTPFLQRAARLTPTVFMPEEIYRAWHGILNEQGWLAPLWPVEHGGTGWNPMQRYIFERECALARTPQVAAQGVRLVGPVLYTFGTPEQKAHYLPRILSGEHFWCQGYSEPEAGSDLASLKTRAVRDGDRYIVNGSKIWTTNAHFASHIFCLVRTDPNVKPQQGISFLLIDMKTPGIEIRRIRLMSGEHELNQVFFDDVAVPAANLVGAEGQGWTIAKFLLENERGGSCLAPGLLVDLADLRKLVAYLPSDRAATLGEDSDFMSRLAMLELETQALEILELRQLAEFSKDHTSGQHTPAIALLMANLRQAIDRLKLEALGSDGLQLELRRPLWDDALPAPLGSEDARIALPTYLNNLAWSIMAGSNEVMRTLIARTVLKL